jgi:hypothetical protein
MEANDQIKQFHFDEYNIPVNRMSDFLMFFMHKLPDVEFYTHEFIINKHLFIVHYSKVLSLFFFLVKQSFAIIYLKA